MNGAAGGTGGPGRLTGRDFRTQLDARINGLDVGDLLTIIELGVGGVVVWEVLIDAAGTPVTESAHQPWQAFTRRNGELAGGRLVEYAQPRDASRVMVARARVDGGVPEDAAALLAGTHDVRAYALQGGDSVKDALTSVIAAMPLRRRYTLLVVRTTPEGTLEPTSRKLFGAGATRRTPPREFRVRIEPAGGHGTTFAVLASDENADRPAFQLVSLHSANIKRGSYLLRATLAGPGDVRFELDGKQVPLSPEDRALDDIVAAIPERLEQFGPAHLIIAIELSGPPEVFTRRVGWAKQLVGTVNKNAGVPVAFSVLGYGAHQLSAYEYAIKQSGGDQKVQELAWAGGVDAARHVLDALATASPVTPGAVPSAKVECLLPGLAMRLGRQRDELGRPVLVTIGSARPHPPKERARDRGLPCPQHNYWYTGWLAMRDVHPVTGFGAIHDDDPAADAWAYLGRDAHGHLNAVDIQQFAVDLGLIRQGGAYIPFPLISNGGR